MKLGFIGCGTISSAIVTGLMAAGYKDPIIVSPRSADVAADLARRFANVTVASTNQAVLDACDVAVLAVRPQILAEVLPTLAFRPDHQVISLVAATSLDHLRAATAPAASVTRAVPMPMVARRQGPTAVYPPGPLARDIFDRLGSAIELADEKDFDAFTTGTAMMASYFRFAGSVTDWMSAQGVPADMADRYVRQMFTGLAGTAAALPDRDFGALADEHETRGGLNEQVRVFLEAKGVFADIGHAMDGVQKRLSAAHTATKSGRTE